MEDSHEASRWRIAGVAALAAAVVIGGSIGFGRRPEPMPPGALQPVVTPGTAGESEPIVVHVAGEVARPGLVALSGDARVADAVAAAGGATADASLTAINLAAPVSDGMQVIVPAEVPGAGLEAVPDDGRVHVNRATVVDLDALPGVGPVLAERIVAHRDERGPFDSVEDLLDVPGIGESKLDAMRDLIVVP